MQIQDNDSEDEEQHKEQQPQQVEEEDEKGKAQKKHKQQPGTKQKQQKQQQKQQQPHQQQKEHAARSSSSSSEDESGEEGAGDAEEVVQEGAKAEAKGDGKAVGKAALGSGGGPARGAGRQSGKGAGAAAGGGGRGGKRSGGQAALRGKGSSAATHHEGEGLGNRTTSSAAALDEAALAALPVEEQLMQRIQLVAELNGELERVLGPLGHQLGQLEKLLKEHAVSLRERAGLEGAPEKMEVLHPARLGELFRSRRLPLKGIDQKARALADQAKRLIRDASDSTKDVQGRQLREGAGAGGGGEGRGEGAAAGGRATTPTPGVLLGRSSTPIKKAPSASAATIAAAVGAAPAAPAGTPRKAAAAIGAAAGGDEEVRGKAAAAGRPRSAGAAPPDHLSDFQLSYQSLVALHPLGDGTRDKAVALLAGVLYPAAAKDFFKAAHEIEEELYHKHGLGQQYQQHLHLLWCLMGGKALEAKWQEAAGRTAGSLASEAAGGSLDGSGDGRSVVEGVMNGQGLSAAQLKQQLLQGLLTTAELVQATGEVLGFDAAHTVGQ
jgi:hypothetical protein